MSLADNIREFAYRQLIAPALDHGAKEITIRAADIHKATGLQNSMPNVCSALEARVMQAGYDVRLIGRTGPRAGANVFFFGRAVDVITRPVAFTKSAQPMPAIISPQPARFSADVVYLVACVKTKRASRSPARDLYVSDWFKSARKFVEACNAPWFILSAEYGLVGPDEVIAPYDKLLKDQSVFERSRWAGDVTKRLFVLVPTVKQVIMLAGDAYAQFLIEQLRIAGISVERPMEGLRQGEQLSWLKRR